MIFAGTITIELKTGHPYIVFEKIEDYKLLFRLVRKKCKLKTKKKRIVRKYVKKFLNEALLDYIKVHSERKT